MATLTPSAARIERVSEANFQPVVRADEILPGSLACIRVGEQDVTLARVGDDFFATQGHCLHLEGPLCQGRLAGHVLSCPWHGWQYDVRTGENEFDRAIVLETYDVRVEDGEVKVAL
jgi:nitrite reductase/ring-hydroxylating ferredoxin subunit